MKVLFYFNPLCPGIQPECQLHPTRAAGCFCRFPHHPPPSQGHSGTQRYFLEIILAVYVALISFHQCFQFHLFISLSIGVNFYSFLSFPSAISISVVLWSHLIPLVSICYYPFQNLSFLLLLFSLLSDLLSVVTDRDNRELDKQTRSHSIE
jgi:hypothetical protein